jgi:tetratricopeptide (TPR) repeat protein
MIVSLSGCSSVFTVKSDPAAADVYFQDPKTGEKKSLGKTPLTMPKSDLRKTVGNGIDSGNFFTVVVEKQGYQSSSFSIPATGFGTMATILDVKLKEGTTQKEARVAKDLLDRLFLAQKFALSAQFERAQIEIDKILTEFPTFPRALSMRASIYFAQKNYEESVKWYDRALEADPQLEDAMRMAAKARALAGGRLPASIKAPQPNIPNAPKGNP